MTHSDGLSTGILESHRVLVCVGAGGVGKTTAAATLAYSAAKAGKKALVLTVDPAKRLANAMGLQEMLPEPTQIEIPVSLASSGGELWAMMLDTRRTFDEVIARHAPSPEARDRLYANPFYEEACASLAGSQEYMAIEELYRLVEKETFDILILDTPPSRHALDFLEAPDRIRGLFDSQVFKAVIQSTSWIGRTGGLFGRDSILMKGMSKIMGGEAFSDLLEFFQAFHGMTEGFSERALSVESFLHSSDVGFLVVCGPDASSLSDARYLVQKLRDEKLGLDGVVVNRVRLPFLSEDELAALRGSETERMQGLSAALGSELSPAYLERASEAVEAYHHLVQSDARNLAAARKDLVGDAAWVEVPYITESIVNMEGLERFSRCLLTQERSSWGERAGS